MKIERISDNQIKCTLSRQDLDEKNIRIAELAYGTDKARALFRELIEQASVELDFEVDESPLMIEAVPTSKDSLVLIVTRVDNPDELDSRFSRFTHLSSDDNIEEIEDFSDDDDDELGDVDDDDLDLDEQDHAEIEEIIKAAEERLASADKDNNKDSEAKDDKASDENSKENDQFSNLREQIREGLSGLISSLAKSVEGIAANVDGNGENPHIQADITIETVTHPQATPQSASEIPFDVYIFKNISDVISAAKDLSRIYFGDNTLYKDESTGRFYLYITNNANSLEDYLHTQQILTRYAAKCRTTYASISYYNEHFKVIRRKNALQLMATI
jgi:adapter protein MecA 1/2